MPDAELLAVQFLRAHPQVRALVGDRVFTEVPDEDTLAAEFGGARPLLRVQRVGGLPVVDGWLDVPRLQVDAYADGAEAKFDAHRLAAVAQAALVDDLPGAHDEAVVTAVRVDTGLSWVADDAGAGDARYLFTVAAYLHPLP